MSKLNFQHYVESRVLGETFDAKQDLAQYLSESGIDLIKFNAGLDIIAEWGFNPLKTFAQSGATGAGAVAGSALGPAGTVLGGMAGNALGKAGTALAGKAMAGSRVQSIQPVYKQAVQAVDSLSKMLSAPDMENVPDAQSAKQGLQNVQTNLQQLGSAIPNIDKQRNQTLDQKLQAGGGVGNKLRNAQGDGKAAKGMRWLGDKIKNIPALNKDQGLRRAMATGMDAVQAWADKNPKKATALNLGAGVAGGLAGGLAAGSMMNQGGATPPPRPRQATSGMDALNNGGTHTATSSNAGEFTHSTRDNADYFNGTKNVSFADDGHSGQSNSQNDYGQNGPTNATGQAQAPYTTPDPGNDRNHDGIPDGADYYRNYPNAPRSNRIAGS